MASSAADNPAGPTAPAAAAAAPLGQAHMPPGVATDRDRDDAVARRSVIGQTLYDTFGQTGARVGAVWIGVIALLAVFAPFLANTHPLYLRTTTGGWSSPLVRFLTPLDVSLVVYAAYAGWVLARRLPAALSLAFLLWPVMVTVAVVLTAGHAWEIVTIRFYSPPWLVQAKGFGRVGGWAWVIAVHLGVMAIGVAGLVLAWRASRAFFPAARPTPVLAGGAVAAAVLMAVAWFAVRPPANVVYEQYRELERAGGVAAVVRTVIPYSPNDRQRDRPSDQVLQPPGRDHWLGTTQFREDVLSRMLHACRVALAIGVLSTSIAAVIGVVIGGVMGYYAGAVDLLGMRVLEIVEAIPTLILLLIVTVFFGRSLYLMMIVIGLVSWTADARFIRAEFLKLRTLDFVQAAVAAGLRRPSIIFRHMLPNGIAPVLVNASFGVAGAILLESTLSFLGLGLGPDDPSWGQLLNQARTGGTGFNWWIATFPGLAIFLTVFAYILIGEATRDALDPRLRKRE